METVVRNQRSGLRIQDFRAPTYYFSLLDRPGWGAWGAAVELALRRLSAQSVAVAPSAYPMAIVKPRQTDFTRTAVVLRGPALARGVRVDARGLYRRIHEWQMMSWLRPDVVAPGTPSAEELWSWALPEEGPTAATLSATWFGEPDEQRSGGARADGGARRRPVRTAISHGR